MGGHSFAGMVSMRRLRRFSHIVGVDDFPFSRDYRGDVPIVGTVYSGDRLEGVLSGRVRRDGANSTRELRRLIGDSKFAAQLQLVLLQGIALAGFNVVDVPRLSADLGLPVLVVARRAPRREAMRRALLEGIPGGARKWALVERLGEMEPVGVSMCSGWGSAERRRWPSCRHRRATGPSPSRCAWLI